MTGIDLGELQEPQDPQPRQAPPRPVPHPATEPDAYTDELNKLRASQAERDASFLASFRQALRADPNLAGEAQRIAAQLGKPIGAVEAHLEDAREAVRVMALRERDLERTHPRVMRSIEGVQFRRIAHDDLDNLIATDDTFSMMERQWRAGRAANERGYIGARAALGWATKEEQARLQQLNAEMQDAARDSGFIASTTQVLGQMFDTVPKALAAGGAAALPASLGGPVSAGTAFTFGSGAALFAQSSMIEGGNAYLDLIDQGVDQDTAASVAFGIGIINGSLELVGAKLVAKPFQMAIKKIGQSAVAGLTKETAGRALGTFVKEYAKGVGGEVSTEVLQEITNVLGEAIARPEGAPEPTWGEIRERLGSVFEKTVQAMSVLGLPGPVIHYRSQARLAAAATQQADAFEKAAELAGESKVRERNPAAHEAFVDRVAKDVGAKDLFIDTEKFQQALDTSGVTREKLRGVLPQALEQLETADRHPELQMDVVLPTAQYLSTLAKTPLGSALMPHVRFEQGDMSRAEADEWGKRQQAMAKEAGTLAQKQQAEDQDFVRSAQVVEERMYAQIAATKAMPAKEARSAARFYRAFVETQAKRLGVTPEAFFARYPLAVKSATHGAAARSGILGQGDFETRFRVLAQRTSAAERTGSQALSGEDCSGADWEAFSRRNGYSEGEIEDFRSWLRVNEEGLRLGYTQDQLAAMAHDAIVERDSLRQDAIDTPEFQAWFAQSKVVDAQGKPLRVYHGTDRAFAEFRLSRGGELGSGIYFTTSENEANSYAGGRGQQGAAQVVPVYLSIQNPLRVTDAAEVWRVAGTQRDEHVGRLLAAKGYDGIAFERPVQVWRDGVGVVDTGEMQTHYVVFDSRKAKFLHQPARGAFEPGSLTALLYEKADISTFLHESAHYYLTLLSDLAAQPNAPASIVADMQTVLGWFGVQDLATWRAMSLEEQRKHHEAFAYSFEIYLFEGEAPSVELQSVFDRFVTWLKSVYTSIRDQLNQLYRREFGADLPILTGEVREVMDRLLASDEQIATAEAVREHVPLFQTQEQAGMSDAEWSAYQASQQEARDAANRALNKDSLGQLQWLSGARSRLLRRMQQEHDAIRSKVRREVVAEVAARPAVRADRWLRTGRLINEDGTTSQGDRDPNHRLDRQAVRDLGFDDQAMAAYLREGGLAPDAVAELFGFESGEEMLAELRNLQPFGEAVTERTNERMLAEHSELADPTEVDAAVERALHNEARARFVAAELRHLQKSEQPVRVMLAAAKEAARRALVRMPVRQVSPKQFAAAEARARRNAIGASKAGDSQAAVEWKRKEMLQHALATAAIDVQREVDRTVRSFDRFRRTDDKLAKTRNTDLVNAARWILSRFGLAPAGQEAGAQRAIEAIRAYNPALYAEFEPMLMDAAQESRDYRDLSVERFRDMVATVEALWFQSKRIRELEVDGERMERNAAIDEMLTAAAKLEPAKLPGENQSVTARERAGMLLMGSKAWLRRVEHWTTKMDGGTPGPWTRFLWRQLRKRVDAYRHDKNHYVQRLRDLVLKLNQDATRIAAPEFDYTFQGRRELIGALLHAGNRSNLNKLLAGRKWTDLERNGTPVVDNEGYVSTAKWDRFVARMIRDGKLTKTDFDFVQAVWDLNEELKPKAQATHHELYGFYFEEVAAEPIRTPWGTYRGGYVPAKVDPELVPEARQRELHSGSLEEIGQVIRDSFPSTGRGFTRSRVQGYTRPLLLDVRLQVRHLDEVLRFIHLQPGVSDVLSILRDQRFSGALNRIDATAIGDMLMPWLERTARQQMVTTSGNRALDWLFSFLRRSTGMGIMFANVVNAAQQITGLSNSALYIAPRFLRNAAWRTRGGFGAERVAALSSYMDERLNNQVGQTIDEIELSLSPSWWGEAQRWTSQHAYFMQRFMQNRVDVITWQAAFDQAMERSGASVSDTEAVRAAVDEADGILRQTQGSQTPEDVARYEAGTPFSRLFTQFSGYFNTVFNQIASAQGVSGKVRATALALTIPAIVAAAIQQALAGGWDDEDDDGYLDEVAGWFFLSQVKAATALVPGVGPAVSSLFLTDRPGDRLALSPVFSSVQSAVRGASALFDRATGDRKELTGRNVRDLLTALSLLIGLPVSAFGRPVGYAMDVAGGREEPSGPIDYARGLVVGR